MKLPIFRDAGVAAAEDIVHACGSTDSNSAIVGDAIDQLVKEGRAAALAANTHKAYRTGWRSWCLWASKRGLPVFPAVPGDLQRWLAALAAEGKKPTTLRTYRAAVAYQHRRSPGPNPARCTEVSQLLNGLSRRAAADGFTPRQAAPLRWRHVEQIADTAGTPRCNRPGGRKETRRQARQRAVVDIAMIALALDALLRCGELLALTWGDINLPANGGCGRVLIRRSKTDQHGQGAVATISEFTCEALVNLRRAGCKPTDRVFNMSPNTVTRRIKAACRAAGIDPTGISSHSPRVGMAQDLAAAGIDMPGLMLAGRWSTAATVARYIQHLTARHTAVARYLESRHHTAPATRSHLTPSEDGQPGPRHNSPATTTEVPTHRHSSLDPYPSRPRPTTAHHRYRRRPSGLERIASRRRTVTPAASATTARLRPNFRAVLIGLAQWARASSRRDWSWAIALAFGFKSPS